MVILSLESSTQVCSAAVTVGGVPIATRISRDGGNHAKLLPVFVDELLAELRERGLRLEAVALSEGPGSYTGLRIGTSLAKGVCYGMQIPLFALPTPLVLCGAYAGLVGTSNSSNTSSSSNTSNTGWLCPMIDARRMEVYTALYDSNLAEKSPIEAKIIDENAYEEALAEHKITFFGDGAAKCEAVIQHKNAHFAADIVPDAQYMGMLVENGLGKRIEGKEIAYYDPMYLKEFVAAQSHVKGLT